MTHYDGLHGRSCSTSLRNSLVGRQHPCCSVVADEVATVIPGCDEFVSFFAVYSHATDKEDGADVVGREGVEDAGIELTPG